jgi:hypothetical protein
MVRESFCAAAAAWGGAPPPPPPPEGDEEGGGAGELAPQPMILNMNIIYMYK